MDRDRIAALGGAAFGLVFVLVNAGPAGAPWSTVLRAVGIVASVLAVGLVLRRDGAAPLPQGRPSAARVYAGSVVLELVALLAGTRLLTTTGRGEYGVAWVALVVGVHFLPFAWAFRLPGFARLGLVLVAWAAVGTLAGLADVGAGDSRAAIALLAGVGSGLTLIGAAAVGFGPRPQGT